MKKRHLFMTVAIATALSTSAGFAADLAVRTAPVVAPTASDLALYGKIYGGLSLPGTLMWNGDDYEMDRGYMFGGAIGIETPIQGVAVELDLTNSSAAYTTFDEYLIATTLMGNIVGSVELGDSLGLYAGVGLGGAYVVDYFDSGQPSGLAFAGQVFAGVEVDVTDNASIFGEVRYQSAFGNVTVSESGGTPYELAYSRTAVLVGLKISN